MYLMPLIVLKICYSTCRKHDINANDDEREQDKDVKKIMSDNMLVPIFD